ncbi:hypothetical protein BTN49_1788 [Candidatus Enterovibrio escicola]|uniref:Uncharacterized protein n=1 Tax=Candidatus Enterovibrio escicola TaxID=1927127 RepID=A0A2A5T331_9GAMM|nr:hypothetical protein [Candidatus Enterovibrio escacola]PCS22567.1 hypothetical protein BTN49_1788 [Candidatus Enterovibrio escacola]
MNTLDAVFVDIDENSHIFLPTWENTSFFRCQTKKQTFLPLG